jgi:hypothetical protein
VPAKPKLASTAAASTHFQTWDEYMEEATQGLTPYLQPLPPTDDDPDPVPAEIPCPSSEQLSALTAAQESGSDEAAFVALFGEELAPRLLLATAGKPFVIRAKMISGLMMHYGMQAAPNAGVPSPE